MEEFATEYTKNISKGGIFLKTDRLLDPNAEIDLTLKFPGHLGEFRLKGRVRRLMSMSHPTDRNRQLYGVGIQFLNPDPEVVAAIDKIAQSNGDSDASLPKR